MRYLTLRLNKNTEIIIENSIWGEETIKYNKEIVSEKTTIWGGNHEFEVIENGEKVIYEVNISIKLFFRIGFDIYRNNEIVLLN